MVSDYEYRELFTDPNATKDVLIVPQGCKVFTSSGQFPTVLKWNDDEQDYTDDPDFIITNDNIYKEKMKLVESINSADNLAFGSCEPSQLRFTIRNEKYIDEEEEDPDLRVKSVVPPLTKTYEVDGEVFLYKAVMKYYIFFNGDSDTLFYVGMFQVEEDKMSNDGKTRDITAYDYLYTLRDMDIFEWYKTLFSGLWSDTNSDDEEEEPEPQPDPGNEQNNNNQNSGDQNNNNQSTTVSTPHVCIRPGQSKWSILAAFEDLYNQTAIYYPDDAKSYPGYAMKWALDDVVFSDSNKNFVNMNYSFTENPKIMNDGSLSLGKFIEDMGLMLGAYPKFIRGNPDTALKETHSSFYNIWDVEHEQLIENWETVMHDCCKFTFVKLPKSSKTVDSGNTFLDGDLVNTGLQQPDYEVRSIELIRAINYNNEEIDKYVTGWSKEEIEAYEKNNKDIGRSYTHYTFKEGVFFSQYLIDYKDYNNELESSVAKTRVKTMLKNVYGALKYRTYRPYELKTISDLCRETGDLIMVKTEFDPLNKVNFTSYILEREVEGIQKMIETLRAKGDNGLPNFGNYKSGSSYSSGTGGGYVSAGGTSAIGGYTTTSKGTAKNAVTPSDLVELIRNLMFHLLDEPKVTKAKVNRKKGRVAFRWEDPEDIETNEPVPATWAGTVVVRKEGSAPLHRWDGTLIVDSTERDYYKNKTLYDNNVEGDKIYYYGIFPYDTEGHYRWTKIIKIDTTVTPESPVIESAVVTGGVNVTLTFAIPQDTNYQHCYIVYMKDEVPTSIDEGEKIELADSSVTEYQVKDLDPESLYYFKIMTSNVDTESKEISVKTLSSNTKWLFTPDFSRDGRDTIQYDASDTFAFNYWDDISEEDLDKNTLPSGSLADSDRLIGPQKYEKSNLLPNFIISDNSISTKSNSSSNEVIWEFSGNKQTESINPKSKIIISCEVMTEYTNLSGSASLIIDSGYFPMMYSSYDKKYVYEYENSGRNYLGWDFNEYGYDSYYKFVFASSGYPNRYKRSDYVVNSSSGGIAVDEDKPLPNVEDFGIGQWHSIRYEIDYEDLIAKQIRYYVDDELYNTFNYDPTVEYPNDNKYAYPLSFFDTITDFVKFRSVILYYENDNGLHASENSNIKIRNIRVGYQNDFSKTYWNGEEVLLMEIGTVGKITISNNHKQDIFKIYSGTQVIYEFSTPDNAVHESPDYNLCEAIYSGGPWRHLGTRPYYGFDGEEEWGYKIGGVGYLAFLINEDEQLAKPGMLYNYGINDSLYEGIENTERFVINEWNPEYSVMRTLYNMIKDNIPNS